LITNASNSISETRISSTDYWKEARSFFILVYAINHRESFEKTKLSLQRTVLRIFLS
jgi:hypothetical protein